MRCSMGVLRVSTAVLALAFLVSGSILPRSAQRLALAHSGFFDKSRRDEVSFQADQRWNDQSETSEENYDRRLPKDRISSLELSGSEDDDDKSGGQSAEIDNYIDGNTVLTARGSPSPPPPPSKRRRLSPSSPQTRGGASSPQRSNNAQRGHSPPPGSHPPDAQSVHSSSRARAGVSAPSQLPHTSNLHDSQASASDLRRSPSSFSSNGVHAKTNNGAQTASGVRPVISGNSRSPGIPRQLSLDQDSRSPALSNSRNSNPETQHGGSISPARAITGQSSVSRPFERHVSFTLPASAIIHGSASTPMESTHRSNNHISPTGMTPDGRTVHSRLFHADHTHSHSNNLIQAHSPFSNRHEHTNGIRRRSIVSPRTILYKNSSRQPSSKPLLKRTTEDIKSNSGVIAMKDGYSSSSSVNPVSSRFEDQRHGHTYQKRAVLLPRTPMRNGEDSPSVSRISSSSEGEQPPWQYSGDRSSMGSISAPTSRAASPQPGQQAAGLRAGRPQLRPDIPRLYQEFNQGQHAVQAQRPPLHQRQRAPALQFFVDLAHSHDPNVVLSPPSSGSSERPQFPFARPDEHPQQQHVAQQGQQQMPQPRHLRTQSAGTLQGNEPALQPNTLQRNRNHNIAPPRIRRNPPRQAAIPARYGRVDRLSSSSESAQVVPDAGAAQGSGPRVYLRGQSPASSQSSGSVTRQLQQQQQQRLRQLRNVQIRPQQQLQLHPPQQHQQQHPLPQQQQQQQRSWLSPPPTPRQSSPPRETRRRRGPN